MNDHPPKWPTGVGDDPWFPGGINNNPEITKRLGEFLAQFGTLEWSLIWMLAITLGGPRQEQMAAAILGPVVSVATRIDIVEGAAESAAIDESTRTTIIGLIGEIRNANTIRNEYVHGGYELHLNTHDVRLTTFPYSTSRKQTTRVLTPTQLDKDVATVSAIVSKILKALPLTSTS